MPPKPKKKLPVLLKIEGQTDDFPFRKELNLSDIGFARAIENASINNMQDVPLSEVRLIHSYRDKLDECKKNLLKRIIFLAKKHMKGIQLEAFLLTFKMGVNKCETSRMYKVSRQSIQIRNKRAVKKVKKLLYQDIKAIQLIAEMQRLRKKLVEID